MRPARAVDGLAVNRSLVLRSQSMQVIVQRRHAAVKNRTVVALGFEQLLFKHA